KLQQVDIFDRPIREEDQRDGKGQGEQSRPHDDERTIAVGGARSHDHDLAAGLRFGPRYGVGDGRAFLWSEGRHCLVLPAPRSSAAAEIAAASGEAAAEIAAAATPASSAPHTPPPAAPPSSAPTPAVPAGPGNENRAATPPSPDLLRAPRQVPDEPRNDQEPEDHHETVAGRLSGVVARLGLGALFDLGSIACQHLGDVAHAILD